LFSKLISLTKTKITMKICFQLSNKQDENSIEFEKENLMMLKSLNIHLN